MLCQCGGSLSYTHNFSIQGLTLLIQKAWWSGYLQLCSAQLGELIWYYRIKIIPSMPGIVLSEGLAQAGRNALVTMLCRMRLQRLEELRTGGSEAQKAAAAYTLSDAALDVDVIIDDAAQPRKRRKWISSRSWSRMQQNRMGMSHLRKILSWTGVQRLSRDSIPCMQGTLVAGHANDCSSSRLCSV